MMKNYLKGGLVLVVITMGLVFLVLKSHRYLNESESVFRHLRSTHESNKSSYELMELGLLATHSTMQSIDAFLAKWEPFLNKSIDFNKVLNDIVELSFSNTVAIAEKTAHRLKLNEGDLLRDSVLISLKVMGKFDRIYAWLGAIEEAYPHLKINELELTAENMNAALTLRLQLPVMI
ncbi:hypothetical protein AYO37_00840 [Opitutia bacterium SCGC AG-212-L18]|nr:hypothetical protein AYO37_00840 [Opitutae bacterium SCGC AG-212-L18]